MVTLSHLKNQGVVHTQGALSWLLLHVENAHIETGGFADMRHFAKQQGLKQLNCHICSVNQSQMMTTTTFKTAPLHGMVSLVLTGGTRGSVQGLVEDVSVKAAGKNHKRPENPHCQKCEEEHSSGERKV